MRYQNDTRGYFNGRYSKYWVWVNGHAFPVPSLLAAVKVARASSMPATIEDCAGEYVCRYVHGKRLLLNG